MYVFINMFLKRKFNFCSDIVPKKDVKSRLAISRRYQFLEETKKQEKTIDSFFVVYLAPTCPSQGNSLLKY